MAPVVSRGRNSAGGHPLTDLIRIEGLQLVCILGTYADERLNPQRIIVHLTLESRLSEAGRTGRINKTVDYDRLAHEVSALLEFREYRLLETAAEECCAMILGIHGLLDSVRIRIEKPEALEGRARSASVEFARSQADFPANKMRCGEAFRSVLLQTQEACLELWTLAPGGAVTEPLRSDCPGLQWPVSGPLSQGGRTLSMSWPDAATQIVASDCRQIVNEGPDSARLFRCWRIL